MAEQVLIIPLRRWVGCAVLLVVPLLLAGGAAFDYAMRTRQLLERAPLFAASLVSVALVVLLIGWRKRVLLDAGTRTAEARSTVFGLRVLTRRCQLSAEDFVLVKSSTTHHTRRGGSSWTAEQRTVLVGPVVLVDDVWDEPQAALAVGWRVARHLGMKVVEERNGKQTTLEPPVVIAPAGSSAPLPPPPPGLEVVESVDGGALITRRLASVKLALLAAGATAVAFLLATLCLAWFGVDQLGVDAVLATSPGDLFRGDGVVGLPALLLVPGGLLTVWLATRRCEVRASPRGVAAAWRSALWSSGVAIPSGELQDVLAQGRALSLRGNSQVLTFEKELTGSQAEWIAARVRTTLRLDAPGVPELPGRAGRGWRLLLAIVGTLQAAALVVGCEAMLASSWLRGTEPVRQALELAAPHPEVQGAVGAPLVVGRHLRGGIWPFRPWMHGYVEIPVSGPRGKARLAFRTADRPPGSGQWRVEEMRLWLGDQPVLLLSRDEQ